MRGVIFQCISCGQSKPINKKNLVLSYLATVEEQQGRDVTLLTLIAASLETTSVFKILSAQRRHSALKRLVWYDFVCLVSKKR